MLVALCQIPLVDTSTLSVLPLKAKATQLWKYIGEIWPICLRIVTHLVKNQSARHATKMRHKYVSICQRHMVCIIRSNPHLVHPPMPGMKWSCTIEWLACCCLGSSAPTMKYKHGAIRNPSEAHSLDYVYIWHNQSRVLRPSICHQVSCGRQLETPPPQF